MPAYYPDKKITADDVPDFDAWGPDAYWSSAAWVDWHRALKAAKGSDLANRIFLETYHEASALAASYDWRSFDATFIEYAKAEGFYDGLFSGIFGAIAKPISVVGSGVQTGVNIVSKTIATIESVFPLILVAVLVVVAVRLIRFARE